MHRTRLLAAVVLLFFVAFIASPVSANTDTETRIQELETRIEQLTQFVVRLFLILAQNDLIPDEMYVELGIDPPERPTPTPRITQPKCPSSGDIEWLIVTQYAEHYELSPNSNAVRRLLSSLSAIWRSVSLLCRKYRELGYTIGTDFAERYANLGAAGTKFRRDIYCKVKPKLTGRELYSWSKSFDFYDLRVITGGQVCGQA